MREIDEGPGSEDLDRFDGETVRCPRCAAEIWHDAPACPSCGAWVDGDVGGRKRGWIALVAVIVLVAFLMAVLGI